MRPVPEVLGLVKAPPPERELRRHFAAGGVAVDYGASHAYADSYADLGIFELVGNPVAAYPDPRLREVCTPVGAVDEALRRLVDRMFELMFDVHGVGLAAPQVGVTVSLFIACPTGEPTPFSSSAAIFGSAST
mgnify:CR=1 FL=1